MATDRRILIDNATLSGVERITGRSKTLNLNYVDSDIACLEKLITAILFSDKLIGIDDYKDSYRSSRLKNFEFVEFLPFDRIGHAARLEEAAAFARSMTFSFEGSKPAGDVVSFFESLRIDPQLRWDVFASSEYLTLSLLVDDPKHAPLERSVDSLFRQEKTDQSLVGPETNHSASFSVNGEPSVKDTKDLVRAFAAGNPSFSGSDGKSALERLTFGYGWVAERSHFYNSVANTIGADVSLSPLRDAFCESCLRIDHPSQVANLIQSLKSKSQESLSKILLPSGQAMFAMRLPFFTAYLISKSANASECIERALTLRNTTDFQDCRTVFHNFDHFSPSEKVAETNEIFKYLEQSCDNLMKKFAVTTNNGLQFSFSVGMSGLSFGIGGKLNTLFRSYKNRPFSRIFRNMAQDMLNVERLGGLHEKLTSSVRAHADATYAGISLTPKFMEYKESPHGRPAEL